MKKNKKLVGLCLQNDLFQLSLNHIQKKVGEDIDVISLPGALKQIAENKEIQEHIFQSYEEIYLYGHRNCAYYDYRGFSGAENEIHQNLDTHFLIGIFFERIKKIKGEIGFIEEKNNVVIIEGQKYLKQYQDAQVDSVLVYPIEFWQSSFLFMRNYINTEKIDRYGYFGSEPDLFINKIQKIKNEIYDISVKKHNAKKIVFLVTENTSQNSTIHHKLEDLVKYFGNKGVTAAVFKVSSITRELVKI